MHVKLSILKIAMAKRKLEYSYPKTIVLEILRHRHLNLWSTVSVFESCVNLKKCQPLPALVPASSCGLTGASALTLFLELLINGLYGIHGGTGS